MTNKEKAWNKILSWECGIESKHFYDWVTRKAASLWERDKKKLLSRKKSVDYNDNEKRSEYREAIYTAILDMECNVCPYSGKKLEWEKIGVWNNEKAKAGGKDYKKIFALMPTVDHKNSEPEADFIICSWEANDAKNDLSQTEFINLCESVLKHHGYKVSGPSGVSGLSSQEK